MQVGNTALSGIGTGTNGCETGDTTQVREGRFK